MRNLTIKRNKTFVGSAMKVRVYIEDANSADIVLNAVSYRFLGTLKNGEDLC